ncbi:MAG: hypothetical protein IT381_19600 [Deltaproteobacteria bacterium]|nr:hypothetical protein [Deltaproteobacteria bacterium]
MKRTSLAVFALCFAVTATARAETIKIYVAERDTPAHKAAEAMADGKTSFWFPKLAKGFAKAGELLQNTENDVRIMFSGKEGGLFGFSQGGLTAPKGSLMILGGYCPDWKERNPFKCPSEILSDDGRPDAFFNFGGNKTLIGTLVISGFVLDAAPSNKYDAKTNSLLKGTSRTIPLIALKQVVTNHLVIADNVFLNGAQRAFEVYHSPMSNDAVADIQNNFFLNTIIPVKFFPALYKGFKTKTINFKNNSVILNWPYNPDPTSSNVGALELWHKDACQELVVEGNLFAYNAGGAMQHDWPTGRMPKMKFVSNLFYMNATLFGDARPEAGVFTGKFGPNPKHQIVVLKPHMEDDYPYEFKDNVVMDPKVPVALVDLGAADSSSVSAKKTVMNDIRGMFGVNKDGGTVAIKNFAPRMGLDLANLPFPAEEKAKPYGVAIAKVFTP